MELVLGRECGQCTVCCTIPPVDVPELQKSANVRCPHCVVTGCSIYDARPDVCRASFCGWRFFDQLDPSWRPDLSGVLLLIDEGIDSVGLKVLLTGTDAPLSDRGVLRFVASLLGAGTPVSLSVAGPPGFHAVKQRLTKRHADLAALSDHVALSQSLLAISAALRNGPFERVVLSSDLARQHALAEIATARGETP